MDGEEIDRHRRHRIHEHPSIAWLAVLAPAISVMVRLLQGAFDVVVVHIIETKPQLAPNSSLQAFQLQHKKPF
jgi:hypothetical protein